MTEPDAGMMGRCAAIMGCDPLFFTLLHGMCNPLTSIHAAVVLAEKVALGGWHLWRDENGKYSARVAWGHFENSESSDVRGQDSPARALTMAALEAASSRPPQGVCKYPACGGSPSCGNDVRGAEPCPKSPRSPGGAT